jgi:hypothetical protein
MLRIWRKLHGRLLTNSYGDVERSSFRSLAEQVSFQAISEDQGQALDQSGYRLQSIRLTNPIWSAASDFAQLVE